MAASERDIRFEASGLVDSSQIVISLRSHIAVFATVGVAWAILMIGAPFEEGKFLLSGVPAAVLVFTAAALLVVSVPANRQMIAPTVALLLPVCLLGVMLFWSTRPDYGAFKFFNLLIVSIIAIPLLAGASRQAGIATVIRCLILILAVLLAATLAFKLQRGFFDRYVLFLMNGPIVFGRLMGVAAILSLLALSGLLRYVAFAVFSAAVLWTMSKGPLLALLLTTIAASFWLLKGPERWWFLTSIIAAAMLLMTFAWDAISTVDWGRLAVLWNLVVNGFQSASAADPNSLGARYIIYMTTLNQIFSNPLGAGLGSWSTVVPESFGLIYPHNLLLELWSECGLVLGTIGLVPFILFLLPGNAALRGAGLFLFLAQMVSGDLLDARYLLCFSALVLLLSAGLISETPDTDTGR